MIQNGDMNSEQLLSELINNDCLDLVKLYQANPQRSFYSLVKELYQLRAEHDVTCKISPLNSEIDNLVKQFDTPELSSMQLAQLFQTLDFNQRTSKMSRFILTQDNHSTFSKPVDLVMFGDSITEWGPWHDALSGISLANRGLSGDTTSGMVQRLPTTLACTPKLVCVMAGINDLSQGYTVEQVLNNYLIMLNYWQEHNIEVWVQSTLYVGDRLSTLNPKVTELNKQLMAICQQRGLQFIDLNSTLCPAGFLPLSSSCDDLHLNSNAYQQWLNIITPLISQRFS